MEEDDPSPVMLTAPTTQVLEEAPNALKYSTLFVIGDDETRLRMIEYRSLELQERVQSLRELATIAQSRIRVKQMRIHQLKERAESILDKEVARHQRKDRWMQEELEYLKQQEEGINSFREFLEEETQRLDRSAPSQRSAPLNRASIGSQSSKKSLKDMAKQSVAHMKKEKEKEKAGRARKKREGLTSSGSSPRPPTSKRLSNTQSSLISNSSSNLKAAERASKPRATEERIQRECNRFIIGQKLELAQEKTKKLQEQTISRTKQHIELIEKSSVAASKASSQLAIELTQEQQEALEELRDLYKAESTLLLQEEKITQKVEEHQRFAKSFHGLTETSDSRGESPSLLNASCNVQTQLSQLIGSLVRSQPQQERLMNDQDDTNIWKESLVTSGNNKTVIFSTESENENSLHVRAGTLNQLIMRLTDEKRHDLNFLKTFITTFQSFTTTDRFFQKLEERYDVPRDQQSDIPDGEWKRNIVLPIQVRVYNVIRLWLDMRFPDLDYQLMKKVNNFIDTRLRKDGHSKFADALNEFIKRKISQQKKVALSRRRTTAGILPETLSPSYFNSISPQSIADHLTYIDATLYGSIQPIELIEHLKSNMRSPNLTRMIERFNAVSSWSSLMIINHPLLADRQAALMKFIDVASCLHKMNNFSGLLSLIGGITNTAVHRMKSTREGIPPSYTETFKKLQALMSSESANKSYREALHSVSPPLVPYIGVYLTDLTFINDGNPNNVEGLINFRKRELIYRVIEEFQQYQQVSYNLTLDNQLLSLVARTTGKTEDELFALSLELEPK